MSRLLVFNFKDFPPNGLSPSERGREGKHWQLIKCQRSLYYIVLCFPASPKWFHSWHGRASWKPALCCYWIFMKWDISGQITIVWGEQAEAGETIEMCVVDQRKFKRCFTWKMFWFYAKIPEGKEGESDELHYRWGSGTNILTLNRCDYKHPALMWKVYMIVPSNYLKRFFYMTFFALQLHHLAKALLLFHLIFNIHDMYVNWRRRSWPVLHVAVHQMLSCKPLYFDIWHRGRTESRLARRAIQRKKRNCVTGDGEEGEKKKRRKKKIKESGGKPVYFFVKQLSNRSALPLLLPSSRRLLCPLTPS